MRGPWAEQKNDKHLATCNKVLERTPRMLDRSVAIKKHRLKLESRERLIVSFCLEILTTGGLNKPDKLGHFHQTVAMYRSDICAQHS